MVLINPEALVFFEKEGSSDIWVDFSDVLMVQNLKTGYLISARLKEPQNLSNEFDHNDFLLSFLEMDLGSVEEKDLINSNRVEAYQFSPVFAIRNLIGQRSDEVKVSPTDQEGEFFLQAKSPLEIRGTGQDSKFLSFDGEGIGIRKNGTPIYPALLKTQGFPNTDNPFMSLPLDFDYDAAYALTEVDRTLEGLQERVYLHTDKDVYMMGEKLLFKAYLMLGNPLLLNEASKVLHIEIVDPTGYSMLHKVFPIENGRSSGEIFLGPELNTKDFIIKAYTLWGANYGADFEFYKPIQVMSSLWEVGQNTIDPKSEGIVVFSDKQVYQSQDSITLNVVVNNQKGSIAAANLSVAVVQANGVQNMNSTDDLLIDFLKFRPQLDHVDSSSFEFDKEFGLTLKGKINDSLPQMNKAKVELMVDGLMDRRELSPDFSGEFYLIGLRKYNEFSVLAKGVDIEGQPIDKFEIELLSSRNQGQFSQFKFDNVQVLSKRSNKIDSLISDYYKLLEGEILLDEVEVEDEKPPSQGAVPYGKPQYELEMKDVFITGDTQQFIYAIVNKLPGLLASGYPPLITNRGGPPLILLNGSPIVGRQYSTFAVAGNQVNEQFNSLSMINVNTIERVEFVRSLATIYGDLGRFGVINIITKTGTKVANNFNTYQEFKLMGLEKITKEAKTEFESTNPTIYWNPNVGISSSQTSATLKFKLPENPGSFWVIVNGINSSGEPVSGRFLMNQKSLGEN